MGVRRGDFGSINPGLFDAAASSLTSDRQLSPLALRFRYNLFTTLATSVSFRTSGRSIKNSDFLGFAREAALKTALQILNLRPTMLWWGLWTAVACLFALHFRLHYDATWATAFRWGLVDWYVWGVLSLLVFWLCRRVQIASEEWWKPLSVHAVTMIAVAACHVAIVILVDRLLYRDPVSFLHHFQGLFTKKATINFLTYSALVGAFHARIFQLQTPGGLESTNPPKPPEAPEAPCRHLLVEDQEREFFISVAAITHIKTAGNYVEIHSRDDTWMIRRTLKQLQSQLDRRFLRISRFVLVNLDHVIEIRRGFKGNYEVVLEGGASHRLTRRYRKRFQDLLGHRF